MCIRDRPIRSFLVRRLENNISPPQIEMCIRDRSEGITEKLKAEHPMEWIGKMNVLREADAKIVNAEVIFA